MYFRKKTTYTSFFWSICCNTNSVCQVGDSSARTPRVDLKKSTFFGGFQVLSGVIGTFSTPSPKGFKAPRRISLKGFVTLAQRIDLFKTIYQCMEISMSAFRDPLCIITWQIVCYFCSSCSHQKKHQNCGLTQSKSAPLKMSQDLSRQAFSLSWFRWRQVFKTFLTSLTPCSDRLWSLNLALRGRSPVQKVESFASGLMS